MPFSKNRQGGGQWYRRRDPLADSVVLVDDDYRFLIKCRIIKNYQQARYRTLSRRAVLFLVKAARL